MKSRLILAAGAAGLLAVAGTSHSQSPQQQAQPSVQPAMQQNAEGPAQSGTDASYGGLPATRSAAGGMRSRSCASGPQCDIYFGQ
jgi:hypothetical protein